jgi:hypothetical protein
MKLTRKKTIILSSVTAILLIGFLLLYFLAINRAEYNLKRLVESQSNGTILFSVEKVKFNIFRLRFDFQKTELRTIDTLDAISGYHVKADRILIDVNTLLSVFVGKHISIDSVLVQSPLIEVMKYQDGPDKKISIPEEMDKVYQSLEGILKVLNLNYLHITNIKFVINDRRTPGSSPITLSNINLTVQNVSKDSTSGKTRFLNADRILLEIYNENIPFPDGFHGIKFKKLRMSTHSQTIVIDSCYIYAKAQDAESSEFDVLVDSLHIYNFDFNLLAKDNILKFDSALCIHPDIQLKLHLKGNGNMSQLSGKSMMTKDSLDLKIKKMLGNLDIGYINVKNANIRVVTEKNNKNYYFNSENDNFSISHILVSDKKDVPIHLGNFEISVRNYLRYSPDSLYTGQFDRISIIDQKIQLINLRINPSPKNTDPLRKEIKMQAFELDEIDWLALIYEQRLNAGHASLIKPEVRMVLPKAQKNEKDQKKTNPFIFLSKLQDKVQIDKFFLEDATLNFKVIGGPGFSLNNCFAGINVKQLLDAEHEYRVIDAFDTLSFNKAEFRNGGNSYSLAKGSYSKNSRTVQFGQLQQRKTGANESITLNNVKIGGVNLTSLTHISLSELSWKNADISFRIQPKVNAEADTAKTALDFKLLIGKINGGPTKLSLITEKLEASTQLKQLSTAEIVLESGKRPKVKGLLIDGKSISLHQKNETHGSLEDFYISDNKPSSINNVLVKLPLKNGILNIMIPKLTFSADIYQSLNDKITADYIELHNPKISFDTIGIQDSSKVAEEKKNAGLPLIDIRRISILQPEIVNLPASMAEKMQFSAGKASMNFRNITSDGVTLGIESMDVHLLQPKFQNDKIQFNPTGKEEITLKGSAFTFKPSDQQSKWSFKLDALNVNDLSMSTMKDEKIHQTILLNSINIEDLFMSDTSFSRTDEFVLKNKNFRLTNGNIQLKNEKINLEVFNLSLSKVSNSLNIDSIAFFPVQDRDAFMQTKEFQTTHNQLYTGKISLKGLDFKQLMLDTVIHARKATLNDLKFFVYKDKRLPFRHGVEKPMLTNLLLNIQPKIEIDSVILKNGYIEYEEFNNKTEQYGKIKLNHIRGAISNVKTFDPLPDDSLSFNAYARLLDTADLRIKYHQSYADSLSGFKLKLIVSAFDLTALNPMLRPFASAELKSGHLDTLRMSVIGRKYVAYGVMKMYYDDLNAVYLKKGDSDKSTVITKSVSFFANRIVHTRNKFGTGEVYAERDPEKGFVNYWVKIVIGGVFTNTGVRTNHKQEKKYKRSIEKHNVPPIPDIPVDF